MLSKYYYAANTRAQNVKFMCELRKLECAE